MNEGVALNRVDVDLAIALAKWLDNATYTMKASPENFTELINIPKWRCTPSGGFKYFRDSIIYRFSILDSVVFGNRLWEEVERIASAHEQLRRHCTGFISSENGFGMAPSLKDMALNMLPSLDIDSDGNFNLHELSGNDDKVQDFLNRINSDVIEALTIWPISHLSAMNVIALDDMTEFRELTTQEKIYCLNFDLISSPMKFEIEKEHTRWFALCHKSKYKKTINNGTLNDTKVQITKYRELEEVIEDFLICVPLISDRFAFHAGSSPVAPHFELMALPVQMASARGVGHSNYFRFSEIESQNALEPDEATALRSAWHFIRERNGNEFKRRVVNAARRLFYASNRSNANDSLVDLMIAAESLYSGSGQGELRYRTSLNAALWAVGTGVEKRRIFSAVRKAYDLRSKIVHGTPLPSDDIASIVSDVKPIILNGVRTAMKHCEIETQSPDWESIIFGPHVV